MKRYITNGNSVKQFIAVYIFPVVSFKIIIVYYTCMQTNLNTKGGLSWILKTKYL